MPVELTDLQIDLTDPESIRDRVPQIEEVVAAKRRAAGEAQKDFETWEALLGKLRSLAGLILRFEEPRSSHPAEISPAAQDAVVRIVEREDRPIMAIGVSEALTEEGHEVESMDAVDAVLQAASAAGRLQEAAGKVFAPNSYDPARLAEISGAPLVPEAHLGLDGPIPQSRAEAAIRVLGSNPNARWTTPEVGQAMVRQGWMSGSENEFASLASTLSRLVAEGKIFRPQRGQYQLAPPAVEIE